MASSQILQNPLRPHHYFNHFSSPPSKSILPQKLNFSSGPIAKVLFFSEVPKIPRILGFQHRFDAKHVFVCLCNSNLDVGVDPSENESSLRPPFDLNLAVVLAGFAFEAYSTPKEKIGKSEIDAADCKMVFLSEFFLREVYDGQLFIKLKKGVDFPAMDPWGTSDPYVVFQMDGQVVKSMVKWATKEPIWNEDFTINIKLPPTKILQVAAWDANLVTPHKRMGNAGISLESLCDGNLHEVLLELEGMGGGGKIYLEVKYKSFDEIDEEKRGWRIPYVSDFLMKNDILSALKIVFGSESVQARQFVQSAFGQLRSFSDSYLQKDQLKSLIPTGASDQTLRQERKSDGSLSNFKETNALEFDTECRIDGGSSSVERNIDLSMQSDTHFWENFADVINQTVVQKLDFPVPEKLRWDGFDSLKRMALQAKRIAEEKYVEAGLATPDIKASDNAATEQTSTVNGIQTESSLLDKKVVLDVLRQTDTILGAWMVLTTTFSLPKREAQLTLKDGSEGDASNTNEEVGNGLEGSMVDQSKAEEMKALFSTAESAMEAWAMLATSLGRPSFIKSEFEKICFLDNVSTDTQVAIWRDSLQRRLVVAFRGTEQARWKDLLTDLMLVPTGLNPERVGGNFKQEVQVHSGFLSAYDSVRNRIMSLIKRSIDFVDDVSDTVPRWHVYVTGHSLGGALATLLALELSSSQMVKLGAISVTMYNFGSPRVGNKRFAEVYNEKIKDSWRIVNHRDIIPTVPRLMGYCHVAQPVYLAAGDLDNALADMELLGDGYQGDMIGESTPDVLVNEFMKGEKQLIEQILQTEINLFRSIRDGSALMQHMEDFYYITLLESVRSNYRSVDDSNSA